MCPVHAQYKPRPSRRLFFHLWGGLCLNSFAEASGLSKLIIRTFVPYMNDIGSAATAARWAGTLTVVLILVGCFFSSRLVLALENSGLTTEQKERILFSLPFVYFIVIFPLA